MANRGTVIALEGVCCAGKSTIVKRLAAHLKAGVIPELPEFGRNLFKPFTSSEAVEYNGHRSVPIEMVRMAGAFGLSQYAEYVVLDRSFLSTLALGYGAIDLIGPEAYQGLARRVLSVIHSRELAVPDRTLYISVNEVTVQQRNLTRVPPLDDYWVDPERVRRQNEFYRGISVADGIEVIDAARELEIVLADCINLAVHAPVASSYQILEAIEAFNDTVG